VRADKKRIKKAVQGLYDIQTKKINTLIRCVRVPYSVCASSVGWLQLYRGLA